LKRLADLRGRLPRFEIDDEAQADACCARKFVLPQASGLAGGSHNAADLGGGEVSSGHDIYRTGNYHGFLKNVHKNFPIGKIGHLEAAPRIEIFPLGNIVASSYRFSLNQPRLRPQHIAHLFEPGTQGIFEQVDIAPFPSGWTTIPSRLIKDIDGTGAPLPEGESSNLRHVGRSSAGAGQKDE
jgi:hypothetical protein